MDYQGIYTGLSLTLSKALSRAARPGGNLSGRSTPQIVRYGALPRLHSYGASGEGHIKREARLYVWEHPVYGAEGENQGGRSRIIELTEWRKYLVSIV